MADETKEHLSQSKRKFIKKAAITSAFVIPTLQTFAIKDLHACSSGGGTGGGGGSWGGGSIWYPKK